MAALPLGNNITNVIVLMLENRSFDNVLGGMGSVYDPSQNFNGLTGSEFNVGPTGPGTSGSLETMHVWSGQSDQSLLIMPFPDPGELFSDMNAQIFNDSAGSGSPLMTGFASNYSTQKAQKISDVSYLPYARNIMQYYNQTYMPVSQGLAAGYAVSDTWFASGPVQTFPNRLFVVCGTPGVNDSGQSYVNDVDYAGALFSPLTLPTIFDAIDNNPPSNPNANGLPDWKLYYHDYPIAWGLLQNLQNAPGGSGQPGYGTNNINNKIANYDNTDFGSGTTGPTFVDDLNNNSLPTFSFIEPRYSTITGQNPNCNHPGSANLLPFGKGVPINIYYGEQLLLDIYTRLYNSNIFDSTLLIVTYDEHGGLFDHVGPTPAISPFTTAPSNFTYNRYGVRVPAIFINPYIASKSICRPQTSGTVFDHTSIISTLWSQFNLGNFSGQSYLTPRDQNAQTLQGLINLTSARTTSGGDPLVDPNSLPLPPKPEAREIHPNSSRVPAFKVLEDHLLKNVEPYKSIDLNES